MNDVQCLVTGASGFLGQALVPALCAQGATVVAQHRQAAAPPDHSAVTRIRCELPGGVDVLPIQGIDTVFHLAGIAHQQADADAYERVNVDASVVLAKRALDAGVRRFVFISSVKAELSGTGISHYARSKALAEQRLRDVCAGSSMPLVIVRPALVYSADAPGHLAWVRRWSVQRLPLLPMAGVRSMISRDDLIRLLCLLDDPSVSAPGLIVATDGERYSAGRLQMAYAEALGRAPLMTAVPDPLWRLGADFIDLIRSESRGSTWQRLAGTEVYEARGLSDMGFKPRFQFEDCLREAAP